MAIIDVHSHLVYDQVFDHDFLGEELVAAQERNGVDITIVQPASCVALDTVRAALPRPVLWHGEPEPTFAGRRLPA